jgi:SAM-dependent methyltransferase
MGTSIAWPDGFERILDEEWTRADIDTLARKYDTVENHGWYRNLEPTLDDLDGFLRDGMRLVDYSGGTGILLDRLLARRPDAAIGCVLVDSSPKFLRLALEKFRDEPRVALRLIGYVKAEKRLQSLAEVLPPSMIGSFDAVSSTNAIHLYYDMQETLKSWHACLRPGGRAFVQSGNILNPEAAPGDWIIDDTVGQIALAARQLVSERPIYESFRAGIGDTARMEAYDQLRDKFFLPVRPIAFYLDQLRDAGFTIADVAARSIRAEVADWYEFLAAYHEGVLGWAGGSRRVDGADPTEEQVVLRLQLMRESLDRVFDGQPSFQACWTYITCEA